MTATAPHFDIEVRTPVDGVFVLDHSELDGPDLLATDPAAGFTWQSLKCDATRIETWRGAHVDGASVTVDVGTLEVDTVIDPAAIGQDSLQTGALIRLRTAGASPQILATYTIDNAVVTESKLEDHAHLHLTGTDAVSSLANTIRYGAASPSGEGEPWQARVGRLMGSTSVPTAPPDPVPFSITLLDNKPVDEVGKWAGGTWVLEDSIYRRTDSVATSTRILAGLTPGLIYQIRIDVTGRNYDPTIWRGNGWDGYDQSVDDGTINYINLGDGSESATQETGTLLFEFTAHSSTETITLQGSDQGESGYVFGISRLRVVEYPHATWAANIVTETSLARHLDIATATAGLGWLVDRDGITRVATSGDSVLAHFSDVHSTTDPLHVCYTHITPAWGTEDVVNDLRIDNITRRRNDDDTAWEDATTALGPFRDRLSAARWGRRSSTIETSILRPPPPPVKEPGTVPNWTHWWQRTDYRYYDIEPLAQQHLERLATPKPRFREITFNAMDFPDLTAALDLYSRVTATRNEVTQHALVISIAHQISPTRWTTTLGLLEED